MVLIRKTQWLYLTFRSHVVRDIKPFYVVTNIHVVFFSLFYILLWRVITRGSGGTRVCCLLLALLSPYWMNKRKRVETNLHRITHCSLAIVIIICIDDWWFCRLIASDYEHRIRALVSVKIKLYHSLILFSHLLYVHD
jgi:hypothetical protein